MQYRTLGRTGLRISVIGLGTMRNYRDSYWAEAILLRNEIQKRLPKKPQQTNLSPIYQNPTNLLGIRVIADHWS